MKVLVPSCERIYCQNIAEGDTEHCMLYLVLKFRFIITNKKIN